MKIIVLIIIVVSGFFGAKVVLNSTAGSFIEAAQSGKQALDKAGNVVDTVMEAGGNVMEQSQKAIADSQKMVEDAKDTDQILFYRFFNQL